MEKEKTNEKEETVDEETTTQAETGGDKPTTTPLIDIANAAAERMEKANIETAKLLSRQEALEQRRALGGMSEAGQTPAKEPEISDKEYAQKAIGGEFNEKK